MEQLRDIPVIRMVVDSTIKISQIAEDEILIYFIVEKIANSENPIWIAVPFYQKALSITWRKVNQRYCSVESIQSVVIQ